MKYTGLSSSGGLFSVHESTKHRINTLVRVECAGHITLELNFYLSIWLEEIWPSAHEISRHMLPS